MTILCALLCAFFQKPALAAEKISLAEKTKQTIAVFQKAQSMREWIDTAPNLSPYERAALRADSRMGEKVPKISVKTEDPGRVYVIVNGEEFNFSYLRQGKIIYGRKTIRVHKGMFLVDLAEAVAKAKGTEKQISFSNLLFPETAFAGSLMRGCATKDLFTLPDIFNSPFGYAPPVWVAAAAISIIRWGGDQFRSCDTHINDLRRLLAKSKVAIKSLNCGSDQWGSDRSIEFWSNEMKDGKYQTVKFNLDYVNYFAEEVKEDGSSERLFVFGEDRLNEVRLATDTGADFQGDCKILNQQSRGEAAKEFAALREKIENYRKVFYYIGEYNSCTACREIETKIVSPRPPSYISGQKRPEFFLENIRDSSSAQ